MTAWFKRTRPETPPVVQDLTEAGEEAPAALWERLQVELWPQCVCRKPAVRVVLIHNLDHCEDGPIPTFVCNECETDVYRFIDDTLACVHRFERWACKTCGGPVAAPHDLIEDVVKL
ncbi:Uncharacterised protein [Mycobacteroides abscessus subsp. abscessus]|nr:hypothetical protein PROPHIGD11-1_40 [Mycobacterium phage prophiGD11-1]SIG76056.1 Uncharacterised protein [Mycobacteroides abscessus subsp. abscessus]